MPKRSYPIPAPPIEILSATDWSDYELLDSGAGRKLERYGDVLLDRPEHRALWQPVLPREVWDQAQAVFQPSGGESGGDWRFRQPIPKRWQLNYRGLAFEVQAGAARHLGVFPEQAPNWNWLAERIENRLRAVPGEPVRALNLFGYTGLATLAAARAGAAVTHVDAAKRAVRQASANLALSGLEDRPVRWIVEDAFKYVQRELRRESFYEGLILDPPKFGRGPDGQVWEFYEALPQLLADCRGLLSRRPLFIVLTVYAIQASALSVYYALHEVVADLGGELSVGELALSETATGRLLSTAVYTRWAA
ncbi:MAG TPA: class I SAM-dependent methyltransferase [Anaerolineales bacterium]|nr:class I SAM-dependent methyltransferase [Anaerolineales bacterium]